MPWEKQFDVNSALSRAMHAFWARGYEATSMQDLVAATGVNRASLYATYGDKRALFLKALRKYDTEVRAYTLEQLAKTVEPQTAVATLFDTFIAQTLSPDTNCGCFMVNTTLELSSHDPEVAEIVNQAQDEIEYFFLTAIKKGQAMGCFDERQEAGQLARQTLASFLGMLVMIRSRPDAATLSSIRDGALKALT